MRKRWQRMRWWLRRTFSLSLRRDLAKQCFVCHRKFQRWVSHNDWHCGGNDFCSPRCVVVWLTSEQGIEYWGICWKREFIRAIWNWEHYQNLTPENEKHADGEERISKRIDEAMMRFSSSSSSSSSDSLWAKREWNLPKIQTD